PLPARLIIAHLGNGASMCAVKDGISIATTMGFSTLDGLPMGTRSGSIDPGVILHLMRANKLDPNGLEDLLYNQSGLSGLSGISGDMRVLLDSPEPAAKRAVAFYGYRVARELGSLAAALGGLDALVFTGGIGENAGAIRDDVLARSAWLDFETWIVPADEETVIARHTMDVLGRS
ncbi:MAG TPA: acetate kinase, partial [Rhodospirillales bacterium]|nr:acetate kinase [Rhodospirillales bacterium]